MFDCFHQSINQSIYLSIHQSNNPSNIPSNNPSISISLVINTKRGPFFEENDPNFFVSSRHECHHHQRFLLTRYPKYRPFVDVAIDWLVAWWVG